MLEKLKKRKLGIPMFFWVLLICTAMTSTVFAYTILQLPAIKTSLFYQSVESSNFNAVTVDGTLKLKKKYVEMTIRITNTDVDVHSAEVIVTCYDNNMDFLEEITMLTNDVAGSTNIDLEYTFNAVNQSSYVCHDIQISDLT